MTRRTRSRIASIGKWAVMAPLMPPFLIHCVAQGIVSGIDWLVDGRWLAKTCFRLHHRIEMWGLR